MDIYTKYNTEDGLKILQSSDDIATVAWGSQWHTPSEEQTKELKKYCSWKSEEIEGTKFLVGTSRLNGEKIYFPITPVNIKSAPCVEAYLPQYATNSLSEDYSKVIKFSCYEYGNSPFSIGKGYRGHAYMIRPVSKK